MPTFRGSSFWAGQEVVADLDFPFPPFYFFSRAGRLWIASVRGLLVCQYMSIPFSLFAKIWTVVWAPRGLFIYNENMSF